MHRIIIALVAVSALTLTACGGAQAKADAPAKTTAAKLPATAVCPVSKESFKPDAKTLKTVHNGKTYYFCCPGCDKKFAANPDKYLAAGPAAAATPGAKKGCSGDCTDECADCKNPTKTGAKTAASLGTKLPAKATCSISGKEFEVKPETLVAVHDGKTHYFCCPGCAKKFAAKIAAK